LIQVIPLLKEMINLPLNEKMALSSAELELKHCSIMRVLEISYIVNFYLISLEM
jgi:hypothetical protein